MRWILGLGIILVGGVWVAVIPKMRECWGEAVKHRRLPLSKLECDAGLWDYGGLPRPTIRCPHCGELTKGKNAYEEMMCLGILAMIPTVIAILAIVICR